MSIRLFPPQEKYRPFIISALAGCLLWIASGGFLHAYAVCLNWESMSKETLPALVGWQPFIALCCFGLFFGLAVEVAKFTGALLHSEWLIIFLPILVGIFIGATQGIAVTFSWWGFLPSTMFRSLGIRLLTGAFCGLIISPATIMLSIRIRRRGIPY